MHYKAIGCQEGTLETAIQIGSVNLFLSEVREVHFVFRLVNRKTVSKSSYRNMNTYHWFVDIDVLSSLFLFLCVFSLLCVL